MYTMHNVHVPKCNVQIYMYGVPKCNVHVHNAQCTCACTQCTMYMCMYLNVMYKYTCTVYLNVMCMYTMHNVHVQHVPKCNVHNAQCTCT